MKWIYRLLTLTLLGAAIAFPFFMKNQNGKPMFSMPEPKDLIPSAFTSDQTPTSLPSTSSQKFYKWQDKQGTWHYGDTPPKNDPNFSTIEVDSNTNVIKSFPMPSKEDQPATLNAPKMTNQTDIPASNILSLDRAMNVLNDAQKVQGLMDNRNAQLDAMNENSTK